MGAHKRIGKAGTRLRTGCDTRPCFAWSADAWRRVMHGRAAHLLRLEGLQAVVGADDLAARAAPAEHAPVVQVQLPKQRGRHARRRRRVGARLVAARGPLVQRGL